MKGKKEISRDKNIEKDVKGWRDRNRERKKKAKVVREKRLTHIRTHTYTHSHTNTHSLKEREKIYIERADILVTSKLLS